MKDWKGGERAMYEKEGRCLHERKGVREENYTESELKIVSVKELCVCMRERARQADRPVS